MTAGGLLGLTPRRRDDLRIGPAVLRATTEVHPVMVQGTGARYELRAKEFFVLARLDGQHTLADVGLEYADRFGVRLGDANWQQLLGLLYGRGLLVSERPVPARPAAGAGTEPDPGRPSNILAGRTRLVADAQALIETLHRRLAFARGRVFLVGLAVACAVMLADLGFQADTLAHDARELGHRPALLLAVGVVLWVSLGLHEIAHGMVGRAYGGTVTEIGVRWQLPVTYLYCLVRDMAFFAGRREQMATTAAGPAMNVVFLLPFWPVWLLVGRDGAAHYALGGLMVLGVLTALGNLLPLPPLDGYKLLGYWLGVSRLATESRRFLGLALAGLVGRGEGLGAYDRRTRIVYGLYGLGSSLLLGAFSAAVLVAAGLWLADRYGEAAGYSPVLVVAIAFSLWRMGVTARARREENARRRSAA